MAALEPLALTRAQHTLRARHGFSVFTTLPVLDVPHRVALVHGLPAVLVWWTRRVTDTRRLALEAAAVLGDLEAIGYVWATATGAPGDGPIFRIGSDGVVPIERLPDATAFAAAPIKARLDMVDWAELHDAYGPATGTRDYLETLLSAADPSEREDAVFRLSMSICHQAMSLSEATAPAIPFLVAAGERSDEIEVLRLLADIAELAALPLDNLHDDEAAWSRRCAMAIGASSHRFAAWVQAQEPERRACAMRLALATRRASPGAAEPLDAILETALADGDMTVRMLAMRALSAEGNTEWLEVGLDDPDLQVRAYAALGCLGDLDRVRRSTAWATMAEVLADPPALDEWFDDVPGLDVHPLPELLEGIASAGRSHAQPVIHQLIELLGEWRTAALLAPTLAVFFPDRQLPDDPAGVDPEQAAALIALARNRRFWRSDEQDVLPEPFDCDTEWAEFRAYVNALPARDAYDPAAGTVEFPPADPESLAAEIITDAAYADPDADWRRLAARVRQLKLGPEVDDAVFGVLCEHCRQLSRLELAGSRVGDDGFAAIRRTRKLRSLQLLGVPLEGPGLAALEGMQRLRELQLFDLPIGDEALAPLAELPRLSTLTLARMSFTGIGLRDIAAAGTVSMLALIRPRMAPTAWPALGAIGSLETLNLADVTLPRAAMSTWGGLAGLVRLQLEGCVVPAGSLSALPTLPALRRLTIQGGAIDENELRELGRMPVLRELRLRRTPLTEHAVEILGSVPRGIRLSISDCGLSAASEKALRAMRRRQR